MRYLSVIYWGGVLYTMKREREREDEGLEGRKGKKEGIRGRRREEGKEGGRGRKGGRA